jgi:hypothetical protein
VLNPDTLNVFPALLVNVAIPLDGLYVPPVTKISSLGLKNPDTLNVFPALLVNVAIPLDEL